VSTPWKPEDGLCGRERCALIYLCGLAGTVEEAVLRRRLGKAYASAIIFLNSSVSTGTTLKRSPTMP